MKKYSHIIILALSLVFCSCSYEYEMPDYSNAVTSYEKAQLEKGIENKIREEYSQNGIEVINIDIKEEHAIEKDANGNIIYDGEARGRVSIYSKSLDLSYTVKHRVKPTGGHYQDVVGYYQRSFNIDVSPFDVKAIVTNDMLTYIPYFYSVSRNKFVSTIIDKAQALNFEMADAITYVTERDKDKKELIRYEHDPLQGMVASQKGAESIDVEVEVYGWPKDEGRVNYNKKQKIGTFVIKDIFLSEINNSTLELTDDMQYEFVRHE